MIDRVKGSSGLQTEHLKLEGSDQAEARRKGSSVKLPLLPKSRKYSTPEEQEYYD